MKACKSCPQGVLQFGPNWACFADQLPFGGTVSPIMIRPVKEQIEHDRVIRVLDHLLRKKYFAVDANVGDGKKGSFKVGLIRSEYGIGIAKKTMAAARWGRSVPMFLTM